MRFKIKNKKGVELTLSTIVIFIILILVLIVLSYFFITHYQTNSANIENVANNTLNQYL